jgi:hypothetical protein
VGEQEPEDGSSSENDESFEATATNTKRED